MLLNYLRLSIRLLIRSPFFALLNVLSLSVGFAVFFILWQYSQNELKSDQFHFDWERIVRLNFHVSDNVFNERISVTHPAFSRQIAAALPELSEHAFLAYQNEFNASYTGDHGKEISLTYINSRSDKIAFKENKLVYSENSLFDFFNITILAGDKRTFLNNPDAIVVSDRTAQKYFGSSIALGETLLLNDSIPFVVTGIFKDLPANSHLEFEAVLPMSRIEKRIEKIDMMSHAWFTCYFRLPRSVDRALLTTKIESLKVDLLTKPFQLFNWSTDNWKTYLQPLQEIAFERVRGDDFTVKSKLLLSVFAAIGIVVLVMAWVNFTNLSITVASKRKKELAARLGVGARPHQLSMQFVVEATVINVISLAVAITFIQLFKNPVHVLLNFPFPVWSEISRHSLFLIAFFISTGIFFSGLYPALITLKRTPATLFGNISGGKPKTPLSYWMTIVQYSIAVVLVIWAFAVNGQLHFILNKQLGFRREQVIVVDLPYLKSSTFTSNLSAFLKSLQSLSEVGNYTVSSSVAGDNEPLGLVFRKAEESTIIAGATDGGVDERFLEFYGIKLLAGRNFLPDNPKDATSLIISKKVLQKLNLKDPKEAIGLKVFVLAPPREEAAEIIGVVDDYSRMPLLAAFQAYWRDDMGSALTYGSHLNPEKNPNKISLQLKPDFYSEGLKKIRDLYSESFQGSLFNWYFLDHHINRHYQSDKIIRNQILVFTGLAIGISCLGLLGMISYKVVEKTKEIGIRKILGAQLHQIANILLKTTIHQVVIAILVGVPAAYFLIRQYNANFIDHLSIQWWHYAVPLLILIFILLVSIVFTVWKASKNNPVDALKYE